jgi:hypothetical protein
MKGRVNNLALVLFFPPLLLDQNEDRDDDGDDG